MTSRYINCADTAKELRKALKAHFPKTTFSVKSKTYSGGASITVGWQDGPTGDEVDLVAGHFAGATFDGMVDLKSHHDTEHNGELVQWGADYVFTNRRYSERIVRLVAARVGERWGIDLQPCVIKQTRNGDHQDGAYLDTHAAYTAALALGRDHRDALGVERAYQEALSKTRGDGIVVTLKPLPMQPAVSPEAAPVWLDESQRAETAAFINDVLTWPTKAVSL